uniref:Transposon Ty3-I Gag-Pol polyprotein n=1 Tax=Cajanus cajan TaxID=3821 RepID=A0A151QQY3_CAJCA|nr:hypothetical protein KK1_046525 [Cajanus cajan]
MLSGEAGVWWQGALQRMMAAGNQVNWENFKRLFLDKYFPDLIQGMCFINGTPLIVLYDSGATHSFISHACVPKLKLPVSALSFELIVETPTSGSVSTSDACLKCPLSIDGRNFMVDLICLPLSQLDVILGMDWLSSNHVLLNCADKSIIFDEPVEKVSKDYLTANQVKVSLQEDA